MKRNFTAKIDKIGINPFVKVPLPITNKMIPSRGYIPINGEINGFDFQQTLVPVRNNGYRLYVNGPMLKGARLKVGDTARFSIEQNLQPKQFPMPPELKKQLLANDLMKEFNQLVPSEKKEILRYLGFLKSEDALARNIQKTITQLTRKQGKE